MKMTRAFAIAACVIALTLPITACSQPGSSQSAEQRKADAVRDTINIRSGYAATLVTAAESGATSPVDYYLKDDGSVTMDPNDAHLYICTGSASDATGDIAGVVYASDLGFKPGDKIKFTYYPAENRVMPARA